MSAVSDGAGPEAVAAGLPLGAALRAVRDMFRAAGLDTPDLDARVLAAHATGLDLTGLVRAAEAPVDGAAAATLREAARRRLAGEPVARILGGREFWGLWFALGPDALVPRPDTETLVETVLRHVDGLGRRGDALRIADVGVGSGAILAALLAELPAARGLGVDLSPGAIETAGGNLARHGLAGRAMLLRGDLAAALAPGRFDVVVSNPPYVPSGDIAGLMPEVAVHDPRLALDGGPDGLDAYRALVGPVAAALVPGGLAAFEIGHDQAAAVSPLMAGAGLESVAVVRDLGGNHRVLRGLKRRDAGA